MTVPEPPPEKAKADLGNMIKLANNIALVSRANKLNLRIPLIHLTLLMVKPIVLLNY